MTIYPLYWRYRYRYLYITLSTAGCASGLYLPSDTVGNMAANLTSSVIARNYKSITILNMSNTMCTHPWLVLAGTLVQSLYFVHHLPYTPDAQNAG